MLCVREAEVECVSETEIAATVVCKSVGEGRVCDRQREREREREREKGTGGGGADQWSKEERFRKTDREVGVEGN